MASSLYAPQYGITVTATRFTSRSSNIDTPDDEIGFGGDESDQDGERDSYRDKLCGSLTRAMLGYHADASAAMREQVAFRESQQPALDALRGTSTLNESDIAKVTGEALLEIFTGATDDSRRKIADQILFARTGTWSIFQDVYDAVVSWNESSDPDKAHKIYDSVMSIVSAGTGAVDMASYVASRPLKNGSFSYKDQALQ